MEVDGQHISPKTETSAVVGQVLVQREPGTRDLGLAAMFLVPGVVLLAATCMFYSVLLSVLTGAFGGLLLYAGLGVLRTAVRAKRPREARYGLRDVVYRDRDGERTFSLDDGLAHPLASSAPRELVDVLAARAALVDQPDDSKMRKAMEWAAWTWIEGSPPCLYVIVPAHGPIRAARDFEEDDAVEQLVARGAEVFLLRLHRRGARSVPIFERRAIRKITGIAPRVSKKR